MRILSIDPGLAKIACALWDADSNLEWAGLVRVKHEVGMERAQKWRDSAWATCDALYKVAGPTMEAVLMVAEIPQVYDGYSEEDKNDLIDLAGVVGAISSTPLIHSIEWSPVPREWKGQLPKEISQARVEARLSPEEKARIVWPIKSLRHNVYDAIHLGLVHLEREGLRGFVK